MGEKEMLKTSIEEFSRLQDYMISCEKESEASVDEKTKHLEIRYPMVSDLYQGCGPMSGVYSALRQCISDTLFVVPCDVPLFSKALAMNMLSVLDSNTDVLHDSVDKIARLIYNNSNLERRRDSQCLLRLRS